MAHDHTINNPILENGYIRLSQIIGNPKAGIPALIPVSKSTWYQGIKKGLYPRPRMLSKRCSAYLVSDIIELLRKLKKQGES